MESKEINNVLQEFENITNIVISENWDFTLEKKLNNSIKNKSSKIYKINLAILVLVLINFSFITYFIANNKLKTTHSRIENFKTISAELLNS